jgi:hypothetical protein
VLKIGLGVVRAGPGVLELGATGGGVPHKPRATPTGPQGSGGAEVGADGADVGADCDWNPCTEFAEFDGAEGEGHRPRAMPRKPQGSAG